MGDVVEAKLRGQTTLTLMKGFVNGWDTFNGPNFANSSPKCYKIVTCDKDDDTVDSFCSTMAGVAATVKKHDYSTELWQRMHVSLLELISFEEKIYQRKDSEEDDEILATKMQKVIVEFDKLY